MKKLFFIILMIGLLPWSSKTQTDSMTVYTSSVVTVVGKIREMSSNGFSWRADKLKDFEGDNIADLLENESNVFIKSYGLNSLATSSIRGGSAGHTLVLWNGLPIQSPMLGLLDLSLLPMQAADEVSLQKGGNSALWGSGAIGGILSLKNSRHYFPNNSIGLGIKFGAFGEWKQDAQVRFTKGNFRSDTRFVHHQAKNDFDYSLLNGQRKTQSNAEFSQQNFFQDIYYPLKNNQEIAAHFWYQKSDRQIPPLTTQNNSLAHQDDEAVRLIIDWKKFGKNSMLNGKIGFFDEQMDYFDDIIGLESHNEFKTFMLELDGQWAIGSNQYIIAGITNSYTQAEAAGYQTKPEEFRSALFASYRLAKGILHFQGSLRQELLNKKFAPIAPEIAFKLRPKSGPFFDFKVSKNYRLPTLNDRYWQPGGNENLLAESGWSQEFLIYYNWVCGRAIFDFHFTVFNRNIDNWILWSLRDGQSFWSANNVTKVWSRGIEPRIMYRHEIKSVKLESRLGYDYIRSTNQVALQNPRIAKGAQLIYTPKHQAFASMSAKWKKYTIKYRHQFTGKSQGVNDAIDHYQTGDLGLFYHLKSGKYSGIISLNVNNLWNSDYRILERRPMPGRHWQLGLKFNFQK